MSDDLPKIEVEHLNRVDTWGSEPKEDNGWISVEDRLPEPYKELLVFFGVGCYLLAIYRPMSGWTCSVDEDDHISSVTHWMEIPLPPMLRSQAE